MDLEHNMDLALILVLRVGTDLVLAMVPKQASTDLALAPPALAVLDMDLQVNTGLA